MNANFFQQYVVDYSIALATGMLNLKKLNRHKEALKIVGFTANQLSELVSTTHILKPIQAGFAQVLEIPASGDWWLCAIATVTTLEIIIDFLELIVNCYQLASGSLETLHE